MKMEERAVILVDGSNFYHRLKELDIRNTLNFNYSAFGKYLAGERQIVNV